MRPKHRKLHELPNKEIVILGQLDSPLRSFLIYENQKKKCIRIVSFCPPVSTPFNKKNRIQSELGSGSEFSKIQMVRLIFSHLSHKNTFLFFYILKSSLKTKTDSHFLLKKPKEMYSPFIPLLDKNRYWFLLTSSFIKK